MSAEKRSTKKPYPPFVYFMKPLKFSQPKRFNALCKVALSILLLESVPYSHAESPQVPTSSIPRPEYPCPQFERSNWLCLNGDWEFEIDQGDSGLNRGLLERPLKSRIVVPFCPESSLSGVGDTDFLNAVWYRRKVTIPETWAGQRIILHFQASDYDTFVWANGREVGRHRGGMTPFSCDLTEIAEAGREVTLVVRVRDDARDSMPAGKQSWNYENSGCHYTRTTGIWQTVWLEPVPRRASLRRPKITPDRPNHRFLIEQPIEGSQAGLRFQARLHSREGVVAEASVACGSSFYPQLDLSIPNEHLHEWSPEDPYLYDIDLELIDTATGKIVDKAKSYAGMRSIAIDGPAVKINGKKVFQRLVLDQGYYPDGIMTAPSDADLEKDIKLAKAAGFNGARLHQKVFEERFLYHADRLGYLVWGEFSDWGLAGAEAVRRWKQTPDGGIQRTGNHTGSDFPPTYITQWLEVLRRDFNHPSIVGWCPMNETHERISERIDAHDDVMQGMFLAAKLYDPTRPVLDTSGYSHRIAESDIYDSHDYTQDPDRFAKRHNGTTETSVYANNSDKVESIPYHGQPYFISEFGGTRWNPAASSDKSSWGYGQGPKTIEEVYQRFEGLCRVLLENPRIFGYCYTQLTDVFQEQNGIYSFDRKNKFDSDRLKKVQQQPAAIEKDANGN